jgi:hypothetical protein
MVLRHFEAPTEFFGTSAKVPNKGLVKVAELIGSSEPVKVCSGRSFANK